MSNIYIQEPPTNGKVLLQTTVGDIDVELWSKEAPKACRNFVQLCMEGYYDQTVFHRLVKNFIVQGGDPQGDGTGGESIYGKPFKDEFHSRLRFVRRGLVAMANSGKDDNESQFFFTLAATPELQNKNTIFGQVTGQTLYNMLKLEDGLTDQDDRPLYPHKIISAKVLANPFPDITPRITKQDEEVIVEKPKEQIKKNFNLLSFGEEAEEDDAEMDVVNEVYKGQSKSSHDLTDDPKLSSVPAVDVKDPSSTSDPVVLEIIRKKLEKSDFEKEKTINTFEETKTLEKDESQKKRKEIKKQIKELKKELRKKKEDDVEVDPKDSIEKEPEKEENEVLHGYHQQIEDYKSKAVPRKGTSERQEQTMKLFEKFKSKLDAAKQREAEVDDADSDEEAENDQSWLTHCLRADDQKVVLAKDANIPAVDRYDLTDPRNPMAERRRNEKKRKR